MSPSAEVDLMIIPSNDEIKSTTIQQIVSDSAENETKIEQQPSAQLPFYLGISEILPTLFLCGACAIVRPETLESLNIKFVVNATVELPDTPLPDERPEFLRVPIKDSSSANLSEYFDQVADMIEKTRETSEGRSLVHCVAGVSRSVSLILAYLIKYEKMSLKTAFHHVKSIRPQIRPNMGFFKQLIEYEEKIHGSSSVQMIYCSALGENIPDVYEDEYRTMEMLYQKYRRNFARR